MESEKARIIIEVVVGDAGEKGKGRDGGTFSCPNLRM